MVFGEVELGGAPRRRWVSRHRPTGSARRSRGSGDSLAELASVFYRCKSSIPKFID